MPDIVLATLNAKFIHAALGLRYLLANLGDLRGRAVLAEFDLQQRPVEVVERLLAHAPRVVGFGVYIWNVRETTEVVALLKKIRPDLVVVLGGPEVSHELEEQPIVGLADHVIPGEADLAFADLCRQLLFGGPPPPKLFLATLPELGALQLPYREFDERDLAHRLLYVEASRGCPFECEFCLSSLDVPVRQFAPPVFLAELERLLQRGARHFKFVDRTFNLNVRVSSGILDFFLERLEPGLFLHFEMVPDRLPSGLRDRLKRFPAGTLQLEVGIQTFNPDVAALISRRQDYPQLENNLRFLRAETGAHVHADLIFGLPGESLESFAAGFDRLLALRPQEIQVGILKRLRGTPIVRHDEAWSMVYSPLPPYEILANRLVDFMTVQRLRRLARFWDLVANSGRFPQSAPLIWQEGSSPFAEFLRFSDWLYGRTGAQHAIALSRLATLLGEYLVKVLGLSGPRVAQHLASDLEVTSGRARSSTAAPAPTATRRQARHRAAGRETG